MRWARNCFIYFGNLLPKPSITSCWDNHSINKPYRGCNNPPSYSSSPKPWPMINYLLMRKSLHNILKKFNYSSRNDQICPNPIFEMTPSCHSCPNPCFSTCPLIYTCYCRSLPVIPISLHPKEYSPLFSNTLSDCISNNIYSRNSCYLRM